METDLPSERVAGSAEPLAEVVGRRSVDYLLRNTQQQLVALTGQADLKASIVITASSLVLSVAATQWERDALQPAVYFLAAGMLAAMGAAILAVVPKFSIRNKDRNRWPAEANSLFFGHFAQVPTEVWVEHMGDVLAEDRKVYRAILVDLHQQGQYLVRMKYRFLRAAYVLMGASFSVAGLVLVLDGLV